MPDIIHFLPDSVANQIAAGEVIQRPASVVKELLENAVDAKATSIQLLVKDAGKTLIRVIDNGCGMSETDARMCFERHATSKIKKADDLFSIFSMGFRGEAMASIASIAQVELKSRRKEDEIGSVITIEGNNLVSQEPCAMHQGTSISVKNLFFNVPARRKFLKSDPSEIRHIIDEFQRVALAYPGIAFSFHHNDNELFHLEKSQLRQRVINVFGKNHNQRLVPVEEETSIVKIDGFVGKPEFAKKTRGEQFFFVNNRFIKSPYLHHAVTAAFTELISKEQHPSYFLMLDINPKSIDINIHPTKTEIKFEDEKSVYAIIRSAVKRSLGKFNISPSIDFNQEASLNIPASPDGPVKSPEIKVNPDYNPFEEEKKQKSGMTGGYQQGTAGKDGKDARGWEQLFQGQEEPESMETHVIPSGWDRETVSDEQVRESEDTTFQLHHKFIVTCIKSGIMVIHQQRAHERIMYEQFMAAMIKNKGLSQQELFPETLEFPAGDADLIREIIEDIRALGFDITEFGKNSFVLQGLPVEISEGSPKEILEAVIESFKLNLSELKLSKRDSLARSMAEKAAIKSGKKLSGEEMKSIINDLFACEMPYSSPQGKSTITTVTLNDLEHKFR